MRRRCAASASRACVNSFSCTSSFWRAASHSSAETVGGFCMATPFATRGNTPKSAIVRCVSAEDESPARVHSLLDLLDLKDEGNDSFLAPMGMSMGPRLFGGQVAAQSLAAACQTV